MHYLVIIFIVLSNNAWGKVVPPNYNFNINELDEFYPDKDFSNLKTKFSDQIRLKNGYPELWRMNLKAQMYLIPILVQQSDNKVTDFFAQLPSYFLHDVFHQALNTKLGVQQKYKRIDEEAVYEWNINGLTHIYSASCTITCFPIFYTVFKTDEKSRSIFERTRSSQPMGF